MTPQHYPDAPNPCDAVDPAAREPVAIAESPASLDILLVEDDALIRMDAADMLRDLGHTVVEVEYGPDALAVLRERHVDVLVTDVGLPGMSGTELAERACRLQPGIGLIFATGDTELKGREGVVVLCKPYDGADLAGGLRRVRGWRQEQDRAERMQPGHATP